jgi:hypothetical protein
MQLTGRRFSLRKVALVGAALACLSLSLACTDESEYSLPPPTPPSSPTPGVATAKITPTTPPASRPELLAVYRQSGGLEGASADVEVTRTGSVRLVEKHYPTDTGTTRHGQLRPDDLARLTVSATRVAPFAVERNDASAGIADGYRYSAALYGTATTLAKAPAGDDLFKLLSPLADDPNAPLGS